MADIFEVLCCKQGSVIFNDNDPADSFYIIRQGSVVVNRFVKRLESVEYDSLGAGDLVGIEAVMSSHPHFDKAVAKTDCELIAVKREQFKQLIQTNAATVMRISTQLSQRIRFLNALLIPASKAAPDKDLDAPNGNYLYMTGDHFCNLQRFNEAYYIWHKYLQDFPNGPYAEIAKMDLAKLESKTTVSLQKYADDDFLRVYPKGAMICAEGENSSEVFIIQKGCVKITKIVDEKEVLLSTVGTGEMFGEMASIEAKARSANAIAVDDCEVMVMSKDKFEASVSNQPQIVIHLTTLLSDRVWYMSRQFRAWTITDVVARCCEMLAVHLEKQKADINNAPHSFVFSPETFCELCMVTGTAVSATILKLTQENVIVVADNKVVVKNKFELVRRTKLYWTMHPLK
jgi:CRP-like cAMP-binding protein